jgi:hypothetical protein
MTSTGFTDDVISLLSVGGEERRAQMLEIFEDVDQPLDEFIKDNIIACLCPSMEKALPFVRQIVARALLDHVDWNHVAQWAKAGSN